MNEPTYKYDEMSDTMYISFMAGEKGTGIELNEQILIRVDFEKKLAVGMTLFNYSILTQPTEMGFRSLPLSGLSELPKKEREIILEILLSTPVQNVLSVSAYTPTVMETIPITSLQSSVLERKIL
jgi:uncharacterized protein YuzE